MKLSTCLSRAEGELSEHRKSEIFRAKVAYLIKVCLASVFMVKYIKYICVEAKSGRLNIPQPTFIVISIRRPFYCRFGFGGKLATRSLKGVVK